MLVGFGHMTCKNASPDVTYNVFGGTLNPAQLNLPVLTFGNCLLKTEVIKWPLKLCVRLLRFYVFFKIQKRDFLRICELSHTFSRTMTEATEPKR